MNVYVYFKIKGTNIGSLYDILPIFDSSGKKRPVGRLTLRSFRPVVMDLEIPCGDLFKDRLNRCNDLCPWYDPDLCDVIKYQRAIWSTGDILNPPVPIEKSRYKIDFNEIKKIYGSVINKDVLNMTQKTKDNEFAKADNNILNKSMLIDKVI